jgi:hypothetical protein
LCSTKYSILSFPLGTIGTIKSDTLFAGITDNISLFQLSLFQSILLPPLIFKKNPLPLYFAWFHIFFPKAIPEIQCPDY